MISLENISGIVALVTSIIGLLPQVYKSYRTKSTEDISMAMLINYFVCASAWIIHGFYVNDTFVIYSNVFGSFVSLISIIQKVLYDKNSVRSADI